MKNILYHVSPTEGLTTLTPNISSHGKPYVYATKNLVVALLFGSNKSMRDFDGVYGGGISEENKPYFYEAYEGAFKRRFENCSCYIYEVPADTFEEGLTSFKAEVVSKVEVPVINCTKVDDLYQTLLKKNEEGLFNLKLYQKDNPQYIEMIKQHIKSRLNYMWKDNSFKDSPLYQFCMEHYPDIMNEFEKENF